MTNEEYFRTMPIELLASFIIAHARAEFCAICPHSYENGCRGNCHAACIEWLKQEHEEE